MVVKCSQTSKLHYVKLRDLSREDLEPVTMKYLTKGAKTMLDMKGKVYPVQFMHFKGEHLVRNWSYVHLITLI